METIQHDPQTITLVTILKNLAYIPAAYLGLSMESFGILAVLMLIDTVLGIIRAGVVHGWREVTSHKASFGILSKLAMISVPVVVALAGKGVGINLVAVASGALSMLIVSETYSILGNVQSIRIRKDIKEFDAVNYTLSRVRDLLEKTLKK